MKNLQRKNFTLVELLAAMMVFSVLLLVSMRMFSATQDLWVNSEQKTSAFADARTAMEFVAVRLQSMVYYENVPFSLDDNSGEADDSLWFATAIPMENREDDHFYLRFLKFERNADDGVLKMKIYSDESERSRFPSLFPPFDGNPHFKSADSARNHVDTKLNSTTDGNGVSNVTIIENVTSFRVKAFYARKNGENWELKYKEGDAESPPYLMEIELSLLDSPASYERWKDADTDEEKKEIFTERGYTFRRAVLLGQRSAE